MRLAITEWDDTDTVQLLAMARATGQMLTTKPTIWYHR
jgi:hypothetical protein